MQFGSKKEVEEKRVIKTSEKYQDFKSAVKWIGIFVFSSMVLYGLYVLFGSYIFFSFFLSLIVSSSIFWKSINVPNERFVESRIEMRKDSEGKYKPGEFIFNEYKIPIDLLKEYSLKGDTRSKFKTKTGTINIVERIDFNKKEIYYSWFSGVSDWEFMIDAETFKIMKDLLMNEKRDLLRNKKTIELHYQIQLIKMYEKQYGDKKAYEKKLESLRNDIKKIMEGY